MNIEDIIKQYKNGKTISDLSKEFKYSRQKIRNILKENNIEINKTPQKNSFHITKELAYKLHHEENLSLTNIAKKYGTTTRQISKFFKNNNINFRNPTDKKYKPNKEELISLYNEMTQSDIAKKFNVSNRLVSLWLESYSIEKRPHSDNTKKFTIPKVEKTNFERYNIRTLFLDEDFQKQCLLNRPTASFNKSKGEIEMLNFLKHFSEDFHSDREILSGKELDAYSEKYNLAFEYNGNYYHSELYQKDKRYHINKTKECAKQNIRLIHIFEDEWKDRNPQVKGFIKSLLGVNEYKIFARNCEIKQIDKITASEFINLYHMQPIQANKLKYCIGIFNEKELLGCMTFGKHHRQGIDRKTIVLNRMVFKENYTVTGGASKMLKYSIKNVLKDYEKIISWSDNRWSIGNVYEKMGFNLEKTYPEDYCYIEINNPIKRIPKQQMQKSKIGAGENETEYQKALELGFVRLWDCGKKRWILNI